MKLSTFLLLLEGKAWFPSVESLRQMDPLEGELGLDNSELFWSEIQRSNEGECIRNWLMGRLSQVIKDFVGLNPGDSRLLDGILARKHTEEMATRRAVWCWFEGYLESSAMWGLYGHQGVAVRTNLERLQRSLPSRKKFKIAAMSYVDRRQSAEGNIHAVVQERPEAIIHSHFLKAIEYSHEKEIRVAAFCPEGAKGVMICGIDSRSLIQEVVISPLLPHAESSAIRNLIQDRIDAGVNVRRSNLIGGSGGDRLSDSLDQHFYGETDENLLFENVPEIYKNL